MQPPHNPGSMRDRQRNNCSLSANDVKFRGPAWFSSTAHPHSAMQVNVHCWQSILPGRQALHFACQTGM